MVIWPVCHAAVTAENAAHVEDTHMQSYTCIAMHRSIISLSHYTILSLTTLYSLSHYTQTAVRWLCAMCL